MKKTLLSTGFLLICLTVLSQEIKVNESNEKIGDGFHNALSVIIYAASPKDIERAWKDKMKGYNAKITWKDEIFADNANIESISANTIDIYARSESEGSSTKFIVAFDLGGAYLSSSAHGAQYKKAETLLYEFAVALTKEAIQSQLDDAEKEHKKLQRALDDLKKDNEKLHSNIEKYKSQIEQAEKDIESNLKTQASTNTEIEKQAKLVESINEKLKSVK